MRAQAPKTAAGMRPGTVLPLTWPSVRRMTLPLLLAALAAGCATPPPPPRAPATTVILLPDDDGHVGSVVLSTASGTQQLDRAYSYARVDQNALTPTSAMPMEQGAVEAAHAGLLAAQPGAPRTFVLHFLLNQSALTEESKALLPAVLAAARARKPTEITLFGHADASGTEQLNMKLSAERARIVAELLRARAPELDRIQIQYFGDKAPLVQTDRRRPEPRNRRVEVMIL
jgi:peptidoglycan-associated lipoprotein